MKDELTTVSSTCCVVVSHLEFCFRTLLLFHPACWKWSRRTSWRPRAVPPSFSSEFIPNFPFNYAQPAGGGHNRRAGGRRGVQRDRGGHARRVRQIRLGAQTRPLICSSRWSLLCSLFWFSLSCFSLTRCTCTRGPTHCFRPPAAVSAHSLWRSGALHTPWSSCAR